MGRGEILVAPIIVTTSDPKLMARLGAVALTPPPSKIVKASANQIIFIGGRLPAVMPIDQRVLDEIELERTLRLKQRSKPARQPAKSRRRGDPV